MLINDLHITKFVILIVNCEQIETNFLCFFVACKH